MEHDEDYAKLIHLIDMNDEPPLFKKPPRIGTLIKLLWVNGEAVGFVIVRLKGTVTLLWIFY